MKPDFKNIDITSGLCGAKPAATATEEWETPERIPVKPVYTKADLEGLEHLNYMSGIPPYLRGPYSAMYPLRPWTIRQYAGFSTLQPVRKVCRLHLTLPHTAATMPTTPVL